MAETHRRVDFSARRIIGFACNQAFVFFLLFMGPNRTLQAGGMEVCRFDLLCTLLFMVVGFGAARALGPAQIGRIFSRPALYLFAIVAALGSLLSAAFPAGEVQWVLAQAALTGIPIAYLLTAWGRVFGRESIDDAVPEVFLGSLAGALVCLVFSLASSSEVAMLVLRLLPLASVVNIQVPVEAQDPAAEPLEPERGRMLSLKVMAGTLFFGLAAGLVEAHDVAPTGAALPYYQVSFVLLAAFLIGGLSLLLSDGFGRGAALNKSYRLAVFVMLVGMLLVPLPVLAHSLMPGQAVVIAGYLGLEAVFIGLFVVLAKVNAIDCAFSFSAGFTSLFAGEFAGVLLANALAGALDSQLCVAVAGASALLSYVFLFTERDFDGLSQIASATDFLEDACTRITSEYGLSKREAEILAFALRGRTNERIAQELVISKSTVDTHLRRIYSKCGVHSRQELLDLAGL